MIPNEGEQGSVVIQFTQTIWLQDTASLSFNPPDPRSRRSASSYSGRRSNSWRPTCGQWPCLPGTNEDWRYLPATRYIIIYYIWPIFFGLCKGYPKKIWLDKRISILGSWNSHWCGCVAVVPAVIGLDVPKRNQPLCPPSYTWLIFPWRLVQYITDQHVKNKVNLDL